MSVCPDCNRLTAGRCAKHQPGPGTWDVMQVHGQLGPANGNWFGGAADRIAVALERIADALEATNAFRSGGSSPEEPTAHLGAVPQSSKRSGDPLGAEDSVPQGARIGEGQ